jgi:hypothetical protein
LEGKEGSEEAKETKEVKDGEEVQETSSIRVSLKGVERQSNRREL